ncbi:angiotensin-converting enzyme family protein [Aphelenchoides avenae]|nr:angiotensin-converting enzyme family protein [Aphelenchus avenae]
MWRSAFEPFADGKDAHFDVMMELESIYEQIMPFYKQLHAYFRRQLSAVYKGDKGITKDATIPAHLLRSLDADNWLAFYEETKPLDQEGNIANEVTEYFRNGNYTARTMFITAALKLTGNALRVSDSFPSALDDTGTSTGKTSTWKEIVWRAATLLLVSAAVVVVSRVVFQVLAANGYTHFPPYATFFFQLVALGILRLVFLIIQWRRKASKKERSNVETSEQAALLLHATFSSSSSYITEVQQVYQQLRQFLKQKSEHYETLFASTGHPSRPSASEQWENRDTSRRNLPTVKKRVESRAYYLSLIAGVLVGTQILVQGVIMVPLKSLNRQLGTVPLVEVAEVSVAIMFLTKLWQRKNSIEYSVSMIVDILARCFVIIHQVLTGAPVQTTGMRLHAVSNLAILLLSVTAVIAENAPTEEHAAHMTGKEMRMMDGDEEISMEDYGEETERTQPDAVDNDAIQQLVDKFLNKGTIDEKKEDKINKEAQRLINSSAYWKLNDPKPEHSIKSPEEAKKWLMGYEKEAAKVLPQVATSAWNYFTTASPITRQYLDEAKEVCS